MFNDNASASSIARKAEFNSTEAGISNFSDSSELVDAVSSGRVALDDIAEEQLPSELQSLEKHDQKTVLMERANKRKALKQEIAELSRQRSEYVAAELKKTGADKDSLDNKIYQAVKKQASKKGLVYSSDTPKY